MHLEYTRTCGCILISTAQFNKLNGDQQIKPHCQHFSEITSVHYSYNIIIDFHDLHWVSKVNSHTSSDGLDLQIKYSMASLNSQNVQRLEQPHF